MLRSTGALALSPFWAELPRLCCRDWAAAADGAIKLKRKMAMNIERRMVSSFEVFTICAFMLFLQRKIDDFLIAYPPNLTLFSNGVPPLLRWFRMLARPLNRCAERLKTPQTR